MREGVGLIVAHERLVREVQVDGADGWPLQRVKGWKRNSGPLPESETQEHRAMIRDGPEEGAREDPCTGDVALAGL